MTASDRAGTAPALTIALPGGFADWLAGAAPSFDDDLFHASARSAMAHARVYPGGETEVTCDVGGLCVIGEQAYRLAHTPGISDALHDAAITALDRFHSAMDTWNGRALGGAGGPDASAPVRPVHAKEGMCVDCGGSGRAPSGEACPQCRGTGRIPTGW